MENAATTHRLVPIVGADGKPVVFAEGDLVHYRFDFTAPDCPVAITTGLWPAVPPHVQFRENVQDWFADVWDALRGQGRRRGDWY